MKRTSFINFITHAAQINNEPSGKRGSNPICKNMQLLGRWITKAKFEEVDAISLEHLADAMKPQEVGGHLGTRRQETTNLGLP
jgi:hypothetical protein